MNIKKIDRRKLPPLKITWEYVEPTEEQAEDLKRFFDNFYNTMFDSILKEMREEKKNTENIDKQIKG